MDCHRSLYELLKLQMGEGRKHSQNPITESFQGFGPQYSYCFERIATLKTSRRKWRVRYLINNVYFINCYLQESNLDWSETSSAFLRRTRGRCFGCCRAERERFRRRGDVTGSYFPEEPTSKIQIPGGRTQNFRGRLHVIKFASR